MTASTHMASSQQNQSITPNKMAARAVRAVAAAPVISGVPTHATLTKWAYAKWLKNALPESQAWLPAAVDLGSEHGIG